MSLNQIKVTGFKSIHVLELELHPLNVLIGANGSGKSNFISLFHLLNQMVEQNFQSCVIGMGGASKLLHFGPKITESISVNLIFGQNSYSCTWKLQSGGSLAFSTEDCFFQSPGYKRPYAEFLGAGHLETALLEEARRRPGKVASYVLNRMKSWRVYHFHDTSKEAGVKQFGDVNDNEYLKPDARNLAAFLYRLNKKEEPYYRNIVDTIRLVAPFFQDFNLRPSPLNEGKIQLEWKHTGSDDYFDVHSLSDGTLRFICLVTLLLQPKALKASTLLLDEPELGLHPYAIQILSDLLKSAAKETQIIVSTQSVTLVNHLTVEDIIVVNREQEKSIFKRFTPQEMKSWLEDYGLGDLWEKNVIGGRPS